MRHTGGGQLGVLAEGRDIKGILVEVVGQVESIVHGVFLHQR